jgi:tryptophan-rich sensory protein
MIIALLVIIALLLLVIASQTRPKGTPLIRPGFLWALAATLTIGLVLLAVTLR